ncbi:MAG: tetratricopeptide repeat protein, partial [Chloroflexota bacterium]
LRAYATEMAHAHDSDGNRAAARRRMLDHYLHTTACADELLHRPRDRPFTLADSRPGVVRENLADQKQALAWFESEYAVLLTLLRQTTGFDTHIWRLAWVLVSYLEYQGHWRDWRDTQLAALDASRRLSDRLGQAHSHRLLGTVSIQLDDQDSARTHLQHALDLFGELGDHVGQAVAHRNLAVLLDRQGRYREAIPHEEQALALFQAAGHDTGAGMALNGLGWFHAHLGDYRKALTCCQQAAELQRKIGDHFGEAATYDSLGYAYRHLGQRTEAIACYEKAADLSSELGDRYNEADALSALGDAHQAFGDSKAARIAWQRALTILEQLGHPRAVNIRARMLEHHE